MMASRTPIRKNLFGFGRKPAPAKSPGRKHGSALTISAAAAQAREAGYRARYTFRDWAEMKRLDSRGQLVLARLGEAYRAGQDRRETDDAAKVQAREQKREKARAKSEKRSESKAASYLSVPDEKKIQEGFKRGLTLNEILQGNPSLRKARTSNPSKFDRCVKEVQAKGGAVSPYAVCTAAGTRNPSDWEAGNRVAGMSSASQVRALKEHIEWVERIEHHGRKLSKQELQILKQRFRKAAREKRNPAGNPSVSGAEFHLGNDGVVIWSDDWDTLTRWAEQKQHGFGFRAGGPGTFGHTDIVYRKRNPASASAEAFEEFHGFAPSEVITVTKKVHYHKHLAAAGELIQLDLWGIDDQGHKISGFKGAVLAFNETKNQLFVEGGDQHVNLEDFGIDSPHELETLGRLTDIGYHTKKTHLGSEGGEAVYVHKFRTTNDGGKHVVVKIARYPDLIYDVRNEQLLFSGGSYEILREGIDK